MVRAKGISSTWITGMSKTYAPPIFHIGISITALYKHKSNTYKTSHKHTHTLWSICRKPIISNRSKDPKFPGPSRKNSNQPTNLPTSIITGEAPKARSKASPKNTSIGQGSGGMLQTDGFSSHFLSLFSFSSTCSCFVGFLNNFGAMSWLLD